MPVIPPLWILIPLIFFQYILGPILDVANHCGTLSVLLIVPAAILVAIQYEKKQLLLYSYGVIWFTWYLNHYIANAD